MYESLLQFQIDELFYSFDEGKLQSVNIKWLCNNYDVVITDFDWNYDNECLMRQ